MNDQTANRIAEEYLSCLSKVDMNGVLSLFSERAMVDSPLYGLMSPKMFYKALFEDTRSSDLRFLNVFPHTEEPVFALHFLYSWTMLSGAVSSFEVIDIIRLDEKEKIVELKIIYDTRATREDYDGLDSFRE